MVSVRRALLLVLAVPFLGGCGGGGDRHVSSEGSSTTSTAQHRFGPPPNPANFHGGAKCPSGIDPELAPAAHTRYLELCRGAQASELTRPCRPEQLKLATNEGQGATGFILSGVLVKHHSGPACTVEGTIAVSLVDASGSLSSAESNPANVRLHMPIGPAAPAGVAIRWGNWCGGRSAHFVSVELDGVHAHHRLASNAPCQDPASPSGFSAFLITNAPGG